MKSSEELAYELLKYRDAHEAAKKRRLRVARNVTMCAASFLCVLAVTFAFTHGSEPENTLVISADVVSADVTYAAPEDQHVPTQQFPSNGEVSLSSELERALEMYQGQDVLFSVKVKLYCDGVPYEEDGAADANDIALRDDSSNEKDMTAEEISSYSPDSDYGVMLCLEGE